MNATATQKLPLNPTPMDVGGRSLLGMTRDDLGVARVLLYAIETDGPLFPAG